MRQVGEEEDGVLDVWSERCLWDSGGKVQGPRGSGRSLTVALHETRL